MASQAPIVIVGAGQAGVQIAESLRQEGYGEQLLLIGNETHPPYQRPPLSKKWLLEPGAYSALALRGAEALARRRIELKLDTDVLAIDRAASQLQLANGERHHYSQLALATGAAARELPWFAKYVEVEAVDAVLQSLLAGEPTERLTASTMHRLLQIGMFIKHAGEEWPHQTQSAFGAA